MTMLSWHPVILHNLNAVFVAGELVFSGCTIFAEDLPYALMYIVWYGAFSQLFMLRYGIVFYPFVDATLPPHVLLPIMLAMLGVFALFYNLGVAWSGAPPTMLRSFMAVVGCAAISCARRDSYYTRFFMKNK